jgi:hypothetical protein
MWFILSLVILPHHVCLSACKELNTSCASAIAEMEALLEEDIQDQILLVSCIIIFVAYLLILLLLTCIFF